MAGAAVCAVGRLTKLAISVHEAGHAVAALALGDAPVHEIWLEKLPRGWSGFVLRQSLDPDREARIALAGPITEHAWFIRKDATANVADFAEQYGRVCLSGWPIEDFAKAKRNIEALSPADPAVLFAAMWRDTAALIASRWAAIVRLGGALRDAGSLDGDTVARIAAGADA